MWFWFWRLWNRIRGNYLRIVPVWTITEQTRPVFRTPQYLDHNPPDDERWLIMANEMTATQEMVLHAKILDRKGNPAPVYGAPSWLTDNTDLLALAPTADGLACAVSAVGPIGSAKVTMRADADMGAGYEEIVGLMDISVTPGKAVTVTLEADTPTEQP